MLPAFGADRIGDIEFFGYGRLDAATVRKALPVREGDAYADGAPALIRKAVIQVLGKGPTDIAAPCCDERGNRLLFIGLPGASYHSFSYDPAPTGQERLPAEIMGVYGRLERALEAAVRKGSDGAKEDYSRGYALNQDATARSIQFELRGSAVLHESALLRVVGQSSDVSHRQVAAHALGYATQSRQQILALVRAARDPDETVRNNATRALAVLARSDARLASEIPASTFVNMLTSGIWSDRNKAAWLLAELTAGRDARLLASIRQGALDALIEMTLWRRSGHAWSSRLVLGRIRGIPEPRLNELIWNGPVQEIVDAARGL